MNTQNIVRRVLDEYVGTQLNIDSESVRDILAEHIAKRIEYNDTQDEFWESINEDI